MNELVPTYQASIDFLLQKLKEYSAIPSAIGKEKQFLEYLVEDFCKDREGVYIKQSIDSISKKVKYVYLFTLETKYEYFFTVHVDRVTRGNKPYINTIVQLKNKILKGQLDNIISLGILRYLWEIGYRFNILFTTEEEVCNSWEQVLEVKLDTGLIPISVDIDAYNSGCLSKIKKLSFFTLRQRDGYGEMDLFYVWKFRNIAVKHKLKFVEDDDQLCLVETGLMSLKTDGRHRGVHIGVPIINYHTNKETTSLMAVYHTIVFIKLILDNFNLFQQKKE